MNCRKYSHKQKQKRLNLDKKLEKAEPNEYFLGLRYEYNTQSKKNKLNKSK